MVFVRRALRQSNAYIHSGSMRSRMIAHSFRGRMEEAGRAMAVGSPKTLLDHSCSEIRRSLVSRSPIFMRNSELSNRRGAGRRNTRCTVMAKMKPRAPVRARRSCALPSLGRGARRCDAPPSCRAQRPCRAARRYSAVPNASRTWPYSFAAPRTRKASRRAGTGRPHRAPRPCQLASVIPDSGAIPA